MILNICSALVVVMYLISSMGYGVHECMRSGAKDVVLLFAATPCQCEHDGNGSNSITHTHSDYLGCCANTSQSHDGKISGWDSCCTTTTYTLSHKQLNQRVYDEDSKTEYAIPLVAVYNAAVPDNLAEPFIALAVKYPSGFMNIADYILQIVCKSQIRI